MGCESLMLLRRRRRRLLLLETQRRLLRLVELLLELLLWIELLLLEEEMVLIGGSSGITVGLDVGDHCPVPSSPKMIHCSTLLFFRFRFRALFDGDEDLNDIVLIRNWAFSLWVSSKPIDNEGPKGGPKTSQPSTCHII